MEYKGERKGREREREEKRKKDGSGEKRRGGNERVTGTCSDVAHSFQGGLWPLN